MKVVAILFALASFSVFAAPARVTCTLPGSTATVVKLERLRLGNAYSLKVSLALDGRNFETRGVVVLDASDRGAWYFKSQSVGIEGDSVRMTRGGGPGYLSLAFPDAAPFDVDLSCRVR